MAAQEPESSIWIVKTWSAANEVLRALNEPNEGELRVEKIYTRTRHPGRSTSMYPGVRTSTRSGS
jgi:hypothetical protein